MDYKALACLQEVIHCQSFEKAAKKMYLTQSAISQKIKNLESLEGCALMTRSLPYKATPTGEKLLAHYSRVHFLEQAFMAEEQSSLYTNRFSIALSRDNLEIWFLDLWNRLSKKQDFHLDLVADDQDKTLDYLKRGEVLSCLSSSHAKVAGAKWVLLGHLSYALVASPLLIERSKLKDTSYLNSLPYLQYDQQDDLHVAYFQKFFDQQVQDQNRVLIPSVRGFKEYAIQGRGLALIPYRDVKKEIKEKKLVDLYPKIRLSVPLYWHYWNMDSSVYRKFNHLFITEISNLFSSKPE